MYIDRPPIFITAGAKLATETYTKFVPRTIEPFQRAAMGQHTLTIDDDGIPLMISIDSSTRVPNPDEPCAGLAIVRSLRTLPLLTKIPQPSNRRMITNQEILLVD